MPIYEYVCAACGKLTEVMQKVSDPQPAACAACGSAQLSKAVSRTAFQLKGGGWYADLYSSTKKEVGGDKGNGDKGNGEKGGGEAAKPGASPAPGGAAPAPSSADKPAAAKPAAEAKPAPKTAKSEG